MIDVVITELAAGRVVEIVRDGAVLARLSDADGHALARLLAARYGYRTVPHVLLQQARAVLATIEEAVAVGAADPARMSVREIMEIVMGGEKDEAEQARLRDKATPGSAREQDGKREGDEKVVKTEGGEHGER